MKYSFIKSSKFKIFSSGLMLTTLTSPLLFTSIAPIQQKQIAPEIKIQSNEFSNTEILKNNVIEYVFENDKKNIDSIKFELNKLVKSNKLDDLSENDLNKFAENLISFTKDHFNDKEVLEEAWYHWFPMVFWYTAYTLTIGSNAGLSLLGELFNKLPTIIDMTEIAWNTFSGKYDAAAIKTFLLITKLLSSMYMNEKDIISNLITDTVIDSIGDFIIKKDPAAMFENYLKNMAIIIVDNYINPSIQKSIRQLREGINFQKVKIWAKYIYYYKLYWG
ncbi:hypothetical protein [Mesomycoplasma ovipneumoniae]|uniref:Uncharacterized protein n=1 Tax=Mesomycoplasma ovipneumoniae TaxID=29562 RepID=A0AAJ2UDI8_9BACT|nr:hypothetical protein [Mesomycoplasma ovipneumoniae]MDW2829786.1 hypothetical protein [Mesomycoplasma ovipneumoniae]MDW2870896.1 hypothetical protein [Mesomycoplasma ovipneumoniae]MDW2893619.1 hypothetical protein [Mesomycoplasma ovipneumoniae]WNM13944.1 hypothetical protein RNL96_02380 [Mesomycoplasma ovipneumoniae]WNM15374.1 hypothetical protein RNM01_01955 [Mesomycoplasma ovipneumoniae]